MKRKLRIIVLALCLLFCACAKTTEETSAAVLAERIRENLSAKDALLSADEDFCSLNFPDAPPPAESAVYYSGAAPSTEFGVFVMESEKDAAEMERAIRAYLETEKESHASLARLYPSADAEEDLTRFGNALVGRNRKTVYYFVGDREDAARVKDILTS